jgi:ribonuclease P protein component
MLPAAHRLRRSNDFATAVRAGRRAGRGGVVVHLMVPTTEPTEDMPAWPGSEELSDHAAVMSSIGSSPTDLAPSVASPAPSRAGFVVSKAVGGAVQRNTVKRRLRHLMAQRLAQLPAGSDVVVRALPQAALSSYPQLGADLDEALAAALRATRGGPRRKPRSEQP